LDKPWLLQKESTIVIKIPGGVKAIIFDMDGVLMLSGGAHDVAYKHTLESVGIDNFDYRRFAGMRTDECFRIVLESNNIRPSNDLIQDLTKQKRLLANRFLVENTPIVPRCEIILTTLSQRHMLCLSSSASRKNIDLFLDASNCRRLFYSIVYSDEVKQAKPKPDIYQLSLTRLGLLPRDCLVIEDSVNGVLAAKAAGISVFAILGTDERDVLVAAGADQIMTDLIELI
jgi:HAD superfamily hydrolase (TIGR01509 family)